MIQGEKEASISILSLAWRSSWSVFLLLLFNLKVPSHKRLVEDAHVACTCFKERVAQRWDEGLCHLVAHLCPTDGKYCRQIKRRNIFKTKSCVAAGVQKWIGLCLVGGTAEGR